MDNAVVIRRRLITAKGLTACVPAVDIVSLRIIAVLVVWLVIGDKLVDIVFADIKQMNQSRRVISSEQPQNVTYCSSPGHIIHELTCCIVE